MYMLSCPPEWIDGADDLLGFTVFLVNSMIRGTMLRNIKLIK
jgi:hypothetical protein